MEKLIVPSTRIKIAIAVLSLGSCLFAQSNVGQWNASGAGSASQQPLAFTQDGKQPYVVMAPESKASSYVLSGELFLPTPAATVQLAGIGASSEEKAEDNQAPAQRTILIGRTADGKALRVGRAEIPLREVTEIIPFSVTVDPNTIRIFAGTSHVAIDRTAGEPVNPSFTLDRGAGLRNLAEAAIPASDLTPLMSIRSLSNAIIAGKDAKVGRIENADLPVGLKTIDGVPFYFAEQAKNAMDVSSSMSGLEDPFHNNNFFEEKTKAANGRLAFNIPGDQYAALHIVAFSAGRANHVPRMTVRVGHYAKRAAILEDVVVDVPVLTERGMTSTPVKLADGSEGFLHHIRVPMKQTANVKEFRGYTLEFTRDLNTHINPPDPSSYGKIPVGSPSDVVVMAATLEPSPVTMTYTSDEGGNVFHDTQKVVFKTTLTNRSSAPAEVRAFATATGPGTGDEPGLRRDTFTAEQTVRLNPGEKREVSLDVTPSQRGWFACQVGVEAGKTILQQRDTTFAVLAPDTRKAMEDSPFGVWEFWFPHSVARRSDQTQVLASLINKGGWRWTYGGSPFDKAGNEDPATVLAHMKEKYKISWTVNNLPNSYQRKEGWFDQAEFDQTVPPAIASRMKTSDPSFKVMHESRSSMALVRRYSEYLGGAPYEMPEAEKQRLEKQFENVKQYGLAVKKAEPKAKIVLINDYPAVADQFLARKLPNEAFDIIGLEGAMFLRSPERQPDWMSLLGQIHQMKRSMAKHGYDKPIWTTEALYHPTEAGGLTLHQQGVISVREAMMALHLGVQRMAAAGLIKDSSDDYHWSNWGSAGFCYRDPEINPKPSYPMYAWMTQVLDQAKPNGKIAVPNNSLHVVDFLKPDGSHVYGVWVAKGQQKVVLKGTTPAIVYDVYGNKVNVEGPLTLIASDTPYYVTGTVLESVVSATPIEQQQEIGKLLIDFDRPSQVQATGKPNEILDKAWETPRLRGAFDTSYVTEDGVTAMKITLKADEDPRKLLPRYNVYEIDQPITLQGRPHEFALRVKGNSGWGRIMFEVVDAKGRVFTSSGNLYAGATNSADSLGQSFISFEGWHTIKFPVVGMYSGSDQNAVRPLNYNWWPTNTPEELLIGPKNDAARQAHEDAVEKHRLATEEFEQAHDKWEAAAAAAKAAGKPAPKEPKPPVEPKLKSMQYMGQSPVSYPIKLTKLLVDMRPSILYLDEERPVANPTIFIDNLGVIGPPPGE